MKILLATSQFAPELGGVPQLLWDFCSHRPDDVELCVLSVRQRDESFYGDFDARAGFRIERIAPRSPAGMTSCFFACRLRTLAREWKPDVIFSGVGYPTAIIASVIAQLEHIPFVVYTHSEDVTIRNRMKQAALIWALHHASSVMTVSDFTRRKLAQMCNVDHVSVIPPGMDFHRFRTQTSLPALAALKSHWLLMTAGRLVWRKGQDTVIRALPAILKHVPNAHYLIVGDGPDANGLRTLANKIGVSKHVTFAGRVSERDLSAYFFACDVFVMPTRPSEDGSEVEGFGIVFLEAAAAGKPVIAGRAGGVGDAVIENKTGILLEPTDVNALAQAVIRLAQDSELCSRLGENARARVESCFSVDHFSTRVFDILRRTLR